jgi:hypothetical protein
MRVQRHSVVAFLKALAGPIVWAAHFFSIYLADAFLCTGQVPHTAAVRWIGLAATVAALAVLAVVAAGFARSMRAAGNGTAQAESSFAFAAPLAVLSMVAIAWTSMPLLLLPMCSVGYG